MSIYYVSELSEKGNNAGSKARNDIDKIFKSHNWSVVNNFAIEAKIGNNSFGYYIKNYYNALRLVWKIKKIKNSIIFYQYPMLKGLVTKRALSKIDSSTKVCFLIHDLDSLRATKEDRGNLLLQEIQLLNKAAVIITHNHSMSQFLINNGLTSRIVELSLFDYISDKNRGEVTRRLSTNIVFAGNLKGVKSNFINTLKRCNLSFTLNLYGPNYKEETISNDRIVYKGNYTPEEVVDKLEGSFGLVWDGTQIDTCAGEFGEYLRYNNPHKLSLYLTSHLPVIVWDESAVSDFVKKEDIGFTVRNLGEISEKIRSLTEDDYKRYLRNVFKISERLQGGLYTNEAISEAISLLR